MEQKSKTHIRPIVIVMIFVFITIGYAYLTSSLVINGSTLLKRTTWDVHFENVQVKDGSVTGEQVTQEPEIDTNKTTVSFHVNLKKPGDYYEFTVDAVNAGTIDAMINSYTEFDLTEDQLKYIETSVTYEDGEEIAEKQQLLAGDFAIYNVKVAYRLDLDADDLPSCPEQLDLEFTVEYIQKDDTAIERRAERLLYNVMKKEAESGSGLALKYTGAHQDSMDVSSSTKDIYHWYATGYETAAEIRDLNNVIFADHCWQMYRTTDTGGVRLVYNGAVDNNKCLSNRESHKGFSSSTENLASNYWYGTSYTYDAENNLYSLTGNKVQVSWSNTTYHDLIGKYTCHSTNENGSCSKLYLVDSYNNNTYANVIIFGANTPYARIGNVPFNSKNDSPAYIGYMYGDVYNYNKTKIYDKPITLTETMLKTGSLSTTYWYSDSISFENVSGNTYRYILNDPYQVSSTSDYSSLVGKYTFNSTSQTAYSNSAFYIAGVNESTKYYIELTSGRFISSYYPKYLGDSINDNGDGTYTINNPTAMSLIDWYNNYASYNNKYFCNDNSTTCSDPRMITSASLLNYNYINAGEKILISKGRNGLTLTNTLLVRNDYLVRNPNNYSEYKYTCGNSSSVCTESSLKMITEYNSNVYTYALNHYWGSSVTWDGSKYTLVDPIEIENSTDLNSLSSHHYMCVELGSKTCSEVAYIYFYYGPNDSGMASYVTLSNGTLSIGEALDDMLKNNTNDSTTKKLLDIWFSENMLRYVNTLEDTIFCNDRNISNLNGWNPNGGMMNNGNLDFVDYTSETSLGCLNITDRFSVSNANARLTYPVGLMSAPEINIMNNARTVNFGGWTMSPYKFDNANSYGIFGNDTYGNAAYNLTTRQNALRPVISIKPGTFYSSGDGSMDNPYIIDIN